MATKTTIVKCPFCGSEKVSKNGHNKTGKQVLKMAVDCTGTRAAGRIPGISEDTVTAVLKKPKIGHGR